MHEVKIWYLFNICCCSPFEPSLTNVTEIPNLSKCLSNGNLGTLIAKVGGRNLGGKEELVAWELGV